MSRKVPLPLIAVFDVREVVRRFLPLPNLSESFHFAKDFSFARTDAQTQVASTNRMHAHETSRFNSLAQKTVSVLVRLVNTIFRVSKM